MFFDNVEPALDWDDSLHFFYFFLGGVRGAGFIYSPLLKDTGRVSTDLIHVTDWLPTILSVAGVKVPENELDGYDQWKTLLDEESSPRKEILLNIDDRIWRNAALIANGWKIVSEGNLYFIHGNDVILSVGIILAVWI